MKTLNGKESFGKKIQVAWVVKDLEATISFWAQRGIGPFVVFDEAITDDRGLIYKGAASDAKISVALAYIGETQIELIHQTNEAESLYRDFLLNHGEGVHHVGFWPDDVEASINELLHDGWHEIAYIHTNGVKGSLYFASPDEEQNIVEVAPRTPQRDEYFGAIKRLSETWDGTRPIRKFKDKNEFLASEDAK